VARRLLADAPTGLLSPASAGLRGLLLCILMAGLPFRPGGLGPAVWPAASLDALPLRTPAGRMDPISGWLLLLLGWRWLATGFCRFPPPPQGPAEAAQLPSASMPVMRQLLANSPGLVDDRAPPCWLVSCWRR